MGKNRLAGGLAAALALLASLLMAVPAGSAGVAPGARFFGSLGGIALNAGVVGFDSQPGGDGYLLGAADGGVFAFGSARFHGSMGGTPLNAAIVDIVAAPDGKGYALAASDGGVFTFGSASFAGSLGATPLQAPIGGIAMHPSGNGYWLWAADGGVFAFGSARFHGSLGGSPVGAPIAGMATSRDGAGYWLATVDGRVFPFGTARDFGDTHGSSPPTPVTDITGAPDGAGYALLTAGGQVLAFGSARFHGEPAGSRFNGTMIDLEYTPIADGYWLLGSDGGILTFPGASLPPGGTPTLRVDTVASGLTIPWDIGFLPDGTMLFTERPGRISALANGTVRLLAAPGDVRAVGEAGMNGIAVDPDFQQTRSVYTCMNTTGGDVRVVRWRIDEAVVSASRVGDVVAGIPANSSGRHTGCRPRFGPDGFLWIAVGDAAVGTNAQNLASLGGKVLRIDAETGAPAPGNLYGRVYTFGHRNPQGLDFRPGSGAPYTVEHGPTRDDEVNVLVAGANYGWDPVPGYNESVPMTDFAKFPDAHGALWSSGFPTVATSGGAFLDGSHWLDWNGALAVATLKGRHLRLLFFDAGNRLLADTTILEGYGRLRTPLQGPDGNLYVTTSNGSGTDRILRLTPS